MWRFLSFGGRWVGLACKGWGDWESNTTFVSKPMFGVNRGWGLHSVYGVV